MAIRPLRELFSGALDNQRCSKVKKRNLPIASCLEGKCHCLDFWDLFTKLIQSLTCLCYEFLLKKPGIKAYLENTICSLDFNS